MLQTLESSLTWAAEQTPAPLVPLVFLFALFWGRHWAALVAVVAGISTLVTLALAALYGAMFALAILWRVGRSPRIHARLAAAAESRLISRLRIGSLPGRMCAMCAVIPVPGVGALAGVWFIWDAPARQRAPMVAAYSAASLASYAGFSLAIQAVLADAIWLLPLAVMMVAATVVVRRQSQQA